MGSLSITWNIEQKEGSLVTALCGTTMEISFRKKVFKSFGRLGFSLLDVKLILKHIYIVVRFIHIIRAKAT